MVKPQSDMISAPQRARVEGHIWLFSTPPDEMDEKHWERYERQLEAVDERIEALTASQLAMLDSLLGALRREDRRGVAYALEIDREGLARSMGKAALIPFDLKRLDMLVDKGLVVAEKSILPAGGNKWVYRVPNEFLLPLTVVRLPEAIEQLQARFDENRAAIEAERQAEAAREAEAERQRLAEIERQRLAVVERKRLEEAARQAREDRRAEAANLEAARIAVMSPAELREHRRKGIDYVAGRYSYRWDWRAQKHVRMARRWFGFTLVQWLVLAVLALALLGALAVVVMMVLQGRV